MIAIDINMERLDMARHNASIYGVENRIVFIHGDFFEVFPDIALQWKVRAVGNTFIIYTSFCYLFNGFRCKLLLDLI